MEEFFAEELDNAKKELLAFNGSLIPYLKEHLVAQGNPVPVLVLSQFAARGYYVTQNLRNETVKGKSHFKKSKQKSKWQILVEEEIARGKYLLLESDPDATVRKRVFAAWLHSMLYCFGLLAGGKIFEEKDVNRFYQFLRRYFDDQGMTEAAGHTFKVYDRSEFSQKRLDEPKRELRKAGIEPCTAWSEDAWERIASYYGKVGDFKTRADQIFIEGGLRGSYNQMEGRIPRGSRSLSLMDALGRKYKFWGTISTKSKEEKGEPVSLLSIFQSISQGIAGFFAEPVPAIGKNEKEGKSEKELEKLKLKSKLKLKLTNAYTLLLMHLAFVEFMRQGGVTDRDLLGFQRDIVYVILTVGLPVPPIMELRAPVEQATQHGRDITSFSTVGADSGVRHAMFSIDVPPEEERPRTVMESKEVKPTESTSVRQSVSLKDESSDDEFDESSDESDAEEKPFTMDELYEFITRHKDDFPRDGSFLKAAEEIDDTQWREKASECSVAGQTMEILRVGDRGIGVRVKGQTEELYYTLGRPEWAEAAGYTVKGFLEFRSKRGTEGKWKKIDYSGGEPKLVNYQPPEEVDNPGEEKERARAPSVSVPVGRTKEPTPSRNESSDKKKRLPAGARQTPFSAMEGLPGSPVHFKRGDRKTAGEKPTNSAEFKK